jgi:anti-sigma regulatory factor (Ser/Thr protein kinase)
MAPNAEPGLDVCRLELPAKLSAMDRLPEWIEGVLQGRSIDDRMQFAIHLCLEEAVSNIIRHGYAGDGEQAVVTIGCVAMPGGQLVFTIEDSAPRFNPLDAPDTPLLDADGEIPVGGRGIRLLRGFAGSLDYEATTTGNRLRIGFPVKG